MNGRTAERTAAHIEVTGVVQGVGFRPFVHRLATELGLDGSVGNDSEKVFVDVAGAPAKLDELARRIVAESPPLAHIEGVRVWPVDGGEIPPGFRIVASRAATGARTLVSPDTAVCEDCLRELCDPADRRFGHPFITCTNCGPRFTIIRDLPYDRPATTMDRFEMCPTCAAEYADPTDRRYHAQPIACHDCGPTLTLHPSPLAREVSDTLRVTLRARGEGWEGVVAALRGGSTVAIKGIGGYHLACDATSDAAIARLRERKHRPDKPLAVMVRDLDAAHEVAEIGEAEAHELCSIARPIVLLRARADSPLSPLVAPGNPMVGVMLPYTPVHHLLFAAGLPPLVMTSGNVSGEPITYRDDQAADRLRPLCDAMLVHDRPIHVPCDDSVVRLVGDALLPIRRSRGYAPLPVAMPGVRRRVLAVGGELKNVFCLAADGHAWVSQHIGDMANLDTLDAFEASVAQFCAMYDVAPDVIVADAHPGYLTTQWAHRRHPGQVIEVQHHHAHVAAVMAEHRLAPQERLVGFAFDGTGYGSDGAIWGGEVLRVGADGFDRLAHLAYVPLPGGDAAIRNPYRVALSYLAAAGVAWTAELAPVRQLDEVERGVLTRQLETGFSCVPTSSMGRLFDAVASLLDLRHRITYEAQAAIDLEIAAERSRREDRGYRFAISAGTDGTSTFDAAPVVRAIVDDLRAGAEPGDVAYGFHVAVAEVVVALATSSGADRVALTGGVFQNALLTLSTRTRLAEAGVDALTHRVVPPNDGGLALGQAWIAAHRSDPTDPATEEDD